MAHRTPTWQETSLASQREREVLRAIAEIEAKWAMLSPAEQPRAGRALPGPEELRLWRLFDMLDVGS